MQEDGSITCMPPDGTISGLRFKLASDSTSIKILAVQSLSLKEARSSVLRGRADVSSVLADSHAIVAAVYQKTHESPAVSREVFLGIWSLTPNKTAEDISHLTPLIVHNLSHAIGAKLDLKNTARFKSAGAKLEIQIGASATIFDLSAVYPRKLQECEPITPDQVSSIELSHDIRLSYAPGRLQLYNSRYRSLLASTHVQNISLKRRRDGSNFSGLRFVAYFSQLKRVLACSGSQLLAIDIHSDASTKHPFKQGSLLIGNILRGQNAKPEAPQAGGNHVDDPDWRSLLSQLCPQGSSQDPADFEGKLKEHYHMERWEDLKKLKPVQRDFIISQIFEISTGTEPDKVKLKLALLPIQLLKWFIKCGFLDDYRVLKALGADVAILNHGVVAESLFRADESLDLLKEYVLHAPYLETSGLTLIIKLLIDRALKTPEAESTMQIHVDSGNSADEENLSNNIIHDPTERQFQSTPSMTCLLYALRRLSTLESSAVSSQMRASFEQSEILALIQLLRQQLFLGGYTRFVETRNYPSPPVSIADGEEDATRSEEPAIALQGIVSLLNGCVDSLGMVGILGSNENRGFIENVVPELNSEIESATKAIEESAYLQGLLRETLRYAESVEKQPFEVRSKVERASDIRSKKGAIVTLYAESDSQESRPQLQTSLPLSLKAEEDVSKQKIRKGGQVQLRSAREMGMLRDRLKAPYSFERLVL